MSEIQLGLWAGYEQVIDRSGKPKRKPSQRYQPVIRDISPNTAQTENFRTLKELQITQQILADSRAILDRHGVETLQLILNSLPHAANLPKSEPNSEANQLSSLPFDNSLEQEIYYVLSNR